MKPSEWIRKREARIMREKYGMDTDTRGRSVACWMEAVEAFLDCSIVNERVRDNFFRTALQQPSEDP